MPPPAAATDSETAAWHWQCPVRRGAGPPGTAAASESEAESPPRRGRGTELLADSDSAAARRGHPMPGPGSATPSRIDSAETRDTPVQVPATGPVSRARTGPFNLKLPRRVLASPVPASPGEPQSAVTSRPGVICNLKPGPNPFKFQKEMLPVRIVQNERFIIEIDSESAQTLCDSKVISRATLEM